MNRLATGYSSSGRARQVSNFLFTASIAAGLMLTAALAGCGKPSSDVSTPADGGVEPTALTPAAPPPLPEKAMLNLADLQPAISKPANPPAKELSPQAAAALAEAKKARDNGQISQAITRLSRAADFEPNSPEILRSLAMAYMEHSEPAKGLDALRKALVIAPDDLQGQLVLAILLAGQQRDEQAIAALRTAAITSAAKPAEPMAAEVLWRLGNLLQDNGYWTAALDCYNQLDEWIDKHGVAYSERATLRDLLSNSEKLKLRRGELMMKLRQPDKAVAPLQEAYTLKRSDAATARLLTEALIGTAQFAKAEKLLVELSTESSQASQLAYLAQALCAASKDKDMPLRLWKAASRKTGSDDALAVALARVADRMQQTGQAIEILRPRVEANPANVDLALALATIHARQKQPAEALKVITRTIAANGAGADAISRQLPRLWAAGVDKQAQEQFAAQASGDDRHAALYICGLLAAQRRDNALAIDLLGRATEAKKDFLPVYDAIVAIHIRQKEHDKANAVAATSPEKTYFEPYLKAKVLVAQQKFADAAKSLQDMIKKARTADPKAVDARYIPALLLLSDAQLGSGQLNGAVDSLFEALKINFDETRAYERLFDIYAAQRQYKDALDIVNKLMEQQPASLRGKILLAKYYLVARQQAQAVTVVQQLLEQAPDDIDVNILAIRVELPGNVESLDIGEMVSKAAFTRAMQRIDTILNQEPLNEDILNLKAHLLLQPGQYVQAAEAMGRLAEIAPTRFDYGRLQAAALMEAGKWEQVLPVVEKQLSLAKDEPRHRQMLIAVLMQLKKYQRAEQLLLEWLKEDDVRNKPQAAWDRRHLLEIYEETATKDALAKAHKLLDEWLKGSHDPTIKLLAATQKLILLGKAKEYQAAVDAMPDLLKQNPTQATLVYSTLLATLSDAKQFDLANKYLDERLTAEKSNADNFLILRDWKVRLLVNADKLDAARQYAAAWLKEDAQGRTPRISLVSALSDREQYEQAIKEVDRFLAELGAAAATSPASAPATAPGQFDLADSLRLHKVLLLYRLNRHAQELALIDEMLTRNKDNPTLLRMKGSLLSEMGKPAESMTVQEKLLLLLGDDPGNNNNLGYLYAVEGVNLDKAEQMLKRAIEQRPNETSFLDTLGWIYYRQGRFSQAGGVFRKALSLEGNDFEPNLDPVIYDHAGDAYYRLGWTQEAVGFWNRAIELAKKEKQERTEIKQLLKDVPAKVQAASKGKQPMLTPVAPKTGATTKPK